eukprot:2526641-Amphidinium_carterae.1
MLKASPRLPNEFTERRAKLESLSVTVVVAVVTCTTSATTCMLPTVRLGSTACSSVVNAVSIAAAPLDD